MAKGEGDERESGSLLSALLMWSNQDDQQDLGLFLLGYHGPLSET